MGEPLNNYKEVTGALQLMTNSQTFALRQKSVTVSTVGVIPRILQLAEDFPLVSLALSLHAPTQELRQRIVPSARAYKLDRLMSAIDSYMEKTGQRVFVEYVFLGPDVNCLPAHAHQLGSLLQGKDVVVNLIPWNPILSPNFEFTAPEKGLIEKFKEILKQDYNISSTVRKEKGQDVSAACGQLVLEHGGRGAHHGGVKDVEDLVLYKSKGPSCNGGGESKTCGAAVIASSSSSSSLS